MTNEQFMTLLAEMVIEERNVLGAKGHDYTQGNADRLLNFKRLAAAFGCSPLLVWAIYLEKHLDAIRTYVMTGGVTSEPIEGRITDARNYLALGRALIEDQKPAGLRTL